MYFEEPKVEFVELDQEIVTSGSDGASYEICTGANSWSEGCDEFAPQISG